MSGLEKQPTAHLFRVGKSLEGYNKNPGFLTRGHLLPTTRMEALAKVFLVNLPGRVKKRAFSANDCCTSPDPR